MNIWTCLLLLEWGVRVLHRLVRLLFCNLLDAPCRPVSSLLVPGLDVYLPRCIFFMFVDYPKTDFVGHCARGLWSCCYLEQCIEWYAMWSAIWNSASNGMRCGLLFGTVHRMVCDVVLGRPSHSLFIAPWAGPGSCMLSGFVPRNPCSFLLCVAVLFVQSWRHSGAARRCPVPPLENQSSSGDISFLPSTLNDFKIFPREPHI